MGGFKDMNEEEKAEFNTIGEAAGMPNLADQVIELGNQLKARLDEEKIERKSLEKAKEEQVPDEEDESQDDSEDKPKPEEKKEADVDAVTEAVVDKLGLEALSNTIESLIAENKSLHEQLTSLSTQVGEVKQAKEEEAEKLLGAPRYAWQAFQASKAQETRTSETALKQGAVPNVVSALAAKQLAQK
jgi:hypothetical protein